MMSENPMTDRDHMVEKIRRHQENRIIQRYPHACRADLVLATLGYERDPGWLRVAVEHGKVCAEQVSCYCGLFTREGHTDAD